MAETEAAWRLPARHTVFLRVRLALGGRVHSFDRRPGWTDIIANGGATRGRQRSVAPCFCHPSFALFGTDSLQTPWPLVWQRPLLHGAAQQRVPSGPQSGMRATPARRPSGARERRPKRRPKKRKLDASGIRRRPKRRESGERALACMHRASRVPALRLALSESWANGVSRTLAIVR